MIVVLMLCYIALRFRLRLSEALSRDSVQPGGFWSGSPLVDLVYRMAYLLVRVDFYPN